MFKHVCLSLDARKSTKRRDLKVPNHYSLFFVGER